MSSSSDGYVVLAAMAVRPYLRELIADEDVVDGEIARVLTASTIDAGELRTIFARAPELRSWLDRFIEHHLPDQLATSQSPATAEPVRVFVCPESDYVDFARGTDYTPCPTHPELELVAAGRIVFDEPVARRSTGRISEWTYGAVARMLSPSTLHMSWMATTEGSEHPHAILEHVERRDALERMRSPAHPGFPDESADESDGGAYDPADEPEPDGGADELIDGGETDPDDVVYELIGGGETDPAPVPSATDDRQINGWIEGTVEPLHILHVQIGRTEVQTLFTGPDPDAALVAAGSIPDEGLETRWLLTSPVPMQALDPTVDVTESTIGGVAHWTATFALTIPAEGLSDERQLGVQLGASNTEVAVTILAPAGIYRTLTLRLPVAADVGAAARADVAGIDDHQLTELASAGLKPPHEWTTPSGRVTMFVGDNSAHISAEWPGYSLHNRDEWTGAVALAGQIDQVRSEAETFRQVATAHLDDLPIDVFEDALNQIESYVAWDFDPGIASPEHEAAWEALSRSEDLFRLAGAGYSLFDRLFPPGSLRRQVMDDAPIGALIEIHWTTDTDGAVGGIPWTLLNRQPPRRGEPVDVTSFLGLSHRVTHLRHRSDATSLFLGAPHRSHLVDVLFWGKDNEPAGVEARWQRAQFEQRPSHVVAPAVGAADPGSEARLLLDDPTPKPAPCLYIFCQHDAGPAGNEPRLRFGSSRSDTDMLDATAFGYDRYIDGPLVFANACGTSAATAHYSPVLEDRLFQNGCRAYIGTETKVPITLASRLARVFFELFEQRVDGLAMPAGEALTLARRWLWHRFRNPGGLFYCYVNEYRLVLAGPDEETAVRR